MARTRVPALKLIKAIRFSEKAEDSKQYLLIDEMCGERGNKEPRIRRRIFA